jgi:hypothetical protein
MIEFHCPYCQKLLKTADDKAGVRANCPGCGQAVTVPDLTHETAQAGPSYAHEQSAVAARPTSDAGAELADEGRAASAPTKVCPMCGETILQAATRCRYCGENLVTQQPEGVPTRIEAGDVLSQAWEIYKNQLGLLIGGTLAMFGVEIAFSILGQVVQVVVQMSVAGARGGRPGGDLDPAVLGVTIIFAILNFGLNCYLQAGYTRLLLKIVRGENADVAEVFSGGRFFWRVVGANLLFVLAFYAGLLLFLIPGLIVALMLWPFMYVIVDRDVGVFESFRRSREITSGNYLACIVLGLAAVGAWLLGFIACLIGLIFTTPYMLLIFAVAYCRMGGQPVGGARRV